MFIGGYNMKKRVISALLVSCLLATLITGCGLGDGSDISSMSKSQLRQAYTDLSTQYNDLANQYDELNIKYTGLQSEDDTTPVISATGDGSGSRLTFNSVDSKIIFPSTFEYPGAVQAASSGKVSIIDGIECTPGSNWICKLNGSSLELESTAGISGTIKVGSQSYLYTADELKSDVIKPWFDGLPQGTLTYNSVFVAQQAMGIQASTPTTIDSENAYLRCGMVGYGDKCLTYIFVYRGDQDASKDESITNLLNSVTIDGDQMQCNQTDSE